MSFTFFSSGVLYQKFIGIHFGSEFLHHVFRVLNPRFPRVELGNVSIGPLPIEELNQTSSVLAEN